MTIPDRATTPALGLFPSQRIGVRALRGLPLAWVLWGVTVAAAGFGPYLGAGVRTEQLVIYGSALILFPSLKHIHLTPLYGITIALWGTILFVAVVGLLSPLPELGDSRSLLAGLDNLLLPMGALWIGAGWSRHGSNQRRAMVDVVASTTCYLLALNALFTVSFGDSQPSWVALHWIGGGDNVAGRAAQLGRYSGIFNQPGEAGLAYSIGLMLALWRWQWRYQQPRRLAIVVALITLGGIMTISKIFILVGVPVFAVMVWRERRQRARTIVIVSVVALLLVGMLGTGVFDWKGQDGLKTLVTGGSGKGRSSIDFLTGGRYGENATLDEPVRIVLDESPLIGYGIKGSDIAYDSAHVELLIYAGLIGAMAAVALIASWAISLLTRRSSLWPEERSLGATLLAVTVAASLGIPSLTANRTSSLIWLLLGLCFIHVPKERRPHSIQDPDMPLGSPPYRHPLAVVQFGIATSPSPVRLGRDIGGPMEEPSPYHRAAKGSLSYDQED